MKVQVYCGGSNEPFSYDVSVADAGHAVACFRCGEFFQLEVAGDSGKVVTFFNPSRVDAVRLWEEK